MRITNKNYKTTLNWEMLLLYILVHYGLYVAIFKERKAEVKIRFVNYFYTAYRCGESV